MRINSKRKQSIFSRFRYLFFILSFLIGGMTFLNACQSGKDNTNEEKKIYYTCSMHPKIHSDKPGYCPVCGMKLIKLETAENKEIKVHTDIKYIAQPVKEVVVGNYNVVSPIKIDNRDTIAVAGHIAFNKGAIYTVSTLVNGRIEKLYANYLHQKINKRQPLMKIYSPKLLKIQRDLLHAVNNRDESLKVAITEELLHLGMKEKEIYQIINSGKVNTAVTIYSPYDGILVSSMTGSEKRKMGKYSIYSDSRKLKTHEGAYVQAGETVFTIQNTATTWALLKVSNRDVGKIKIGDKVLLSSDAAQNEVINAQVNLIPPSRGIGKKKAIVRVVLSNPWKIGTLIHGYIITKQSEQDWLVPILAVDRLGRHAFVWVQNKEKQNIYQKRAVEVGAEADGQIRILSGLNANDRIIKNVAYIVGNDNFIQ